MKPRALFGPVGLFTLLTLLLVPDQSVAAQDFTRESIAVGGLTRTYLVHVPAAWQPRDAPIIDVLR